MLITKRCPWTGKVNTIDVPITDQQLFDWQIGGKLIQNVMPNLSSDMREFLISGTKPGDWSKYMGEEG